MLLAACGTGCVEFNYPDGVYLCNPGEADTCPAGMTCRWSPDHSEDRCFEDNTTTGDCALGTCTGCCDGPEPTALCLPGLNYNACGFDGNLCRQCTGEEVCSDGVCTGACTGGLNECGGECVLLDRDPINCGGCGITCRADQFCEAGGCTCRPGLIECEIPLLGFLCLDPESSPGACGGCGEASSLCNVDPNMFCDEGSCSTGCSGPRVDCPQYGSFNCIDFSWNHPSFCGSCDDVCDTTDVCTPEGCMGFYPVFSCDNCNQGEACCNYPTSDEPICVVGTDTCPTFGL